MIFLLTEKALKKNLSKLVFPKDYLIVDGQDDETAELSRKYANSVTMDAFNPPNKCVKARLEGDSFYDITIDEDKVEKLEKKWKNSTELEKSITALVDTFVSKGQINIFIILKKNVYKAYANSLKKKITSMFTDDSTSRIKFVYTFDEWKDDSKSLKRDLKKEDLEVLKVSLDARRELIKKNEEEDEKNRKAKGKKKRRHYDDDED